MFCLSLNQPNISCEKICGEIQKLINKYHSENPGMNSNSIMVIDIRPIIDSQGDLGPPKLEHKVIES